MMKMATMKKSRSYDQSKLKIVCDDLCDNIDGLLDLLGLTYKNSGKMIIMSCPIHGGDNDAALNLYPNGDVYRGNWKCRTHQCEQHFKGSIIGFVRGVLSHQQHNWSKPNDNTCSFDEALNFCLSFINKDMKSIRVSKSSKNKQAFTSVVNNMTNNHVANDSNISNNKARITRDIARKSLVVPSAYFIERGFSKDILDKYDVGLCDNSEKEMYNRAVAPIYDIKYEYIVGCTGRSIFNQCSSCKMYHSPDHACPNDATKWKFPKWKHNIDFKSQNHLYNYWFAKKYIGQTNTVILVESPGNVWRLEENNIHNSVAMFGSTLSDRQKILLDSSGAMNLVILTDNDEAGIKAANQIENKCKNTYRIFRPKISTNDIADMSPDQIQNEIKLYLQERNI
jgi:5S rRNA maturation endonuclease (ribonuclease M5)